MVSNRHMNSVAMKRFKRVHVQHKISYAVHKVEKKEEKMIQPQPEKKPVEESYVMMPVEEKQEDVVEVKKPKKKRKKKVVETIENNEEKPENDG